MSLTVQPLSGAELHAAVDDLSRLRIAVFADFPYLYDGTAAYEAQYLRDFLASPAAVIVVARDGERIVGAATASPLADQEAYIRTPFVRAGVDPRAVFYFGESVLLAEYRGRGIGHAFFDQREAAARRHGAKRTSFCAVVREADHPHRPHDYVPLDAFWTKRGYAPVEGLTGSFSWKEHGSEGESEHPMQYWMREL